MNDAFLKNIADVLENTTEIPTFMPQNIISICGIKKNSKKIEEMEL